MTDTEIKSMNFKKKIAKILNLKTQPIRSKSTTSDWAYKLSVRQVSLIFEVKNLKCFGLFGRLKKFKSFIVEYDKMFNNKSDKNFDVELFRSKLYTKHLKFNAMYDSLLYCQGKNAKKEFLEMFGYEYNGVDDLNRIVKKNSFILDKLKMLMPVETKKQDGITFTQAVAYVEGSKELSIDRNMKLFEFKILYDIELKKWQT